MSGPPLITPDGTHSFNQSNIPILTLAINMTFPFRLLKLNQNNKLNFSQKNVNSVLSGGTVPQLCGGCV